VVRGCSFPRLTLDYTEFNRGVVKMLRPITRLVRPTTARVVASGSVVALPARSIHRGHSSTAISPSSSASHALHPPTHNLSATSIFRPLDTFAPRHIGPREDDVSQMLSFLGYKSMEEFVNATVPSDIRISELSDTEIKPFSELELLRRAERLAEQNRPMKSYIGMGYHNAIVPPVIQRNVSTVS
jgi:glycine dehydrogenase